MIPLECASIRSIARCVLPVLVGPSTAVTPAPGARSLANPACGEKAIFFGCFYCGLFLLVIASEAKQSILKQRKYGLLRRFAPRNDEKLLDSPGAFAAECVSDCDAYQPIWRRFLRLRTSPERIAAESLTLPSNRFRSPQHLALALLCQH